MSHSGPATERPTADVPHAVARTIGSASKTAHHPSAIRTRSTFSMPPPSAPDRRPTCTCYRTLETHIDCLRRPVIRDHDHYGLHRPVALRADPRGVRLRVVVGERSRDQNHEQPPCPVRAWLRLLSDEAGLRKAERSRVYAYSRQIDSSVSRGGRTSLFVPGRCSLGRAVSGVSPTILCRMRAGPAGPTVR